MQTAGQLILNSILPEDLRDPNRVLDKRGISQLLSQVAKTHPDKYRQIAQQLSDVGWKVSQDTGGFSFGLQHLRKSPYAAALRTEIEGKLQKITDDDSLDDKKREELIVRAVGDRQKEQQEGVYNEAKAANNPLAHQLAGAGRGNKMNLSSLLGSDMLYADHRGSVIPVPIMRSYSEGLQPWAYWAGSYGARKGVLDLKMATSDAGFTGKQLNQITHRLVVVGDDHEHQGDDKDNLRGMPVDTEDVDNEGALLAHNIGPYKRNALLTPKVLADLKSRGHNRILVRSPIVGGSQEGGIYARDAGVREHGTLPGRGSNPGMTAVQAISEPLTQSSISSKHSGGVAGQGKAVSGFERISNMIQIPKTVKGGATHADTDGQVGRTEDAPAGGKYVWINGQRHYVRDGSNITVKKGDQVEAGDMITDGFPDPASVVKHKGIGEGRRYFVNAFRDAVTAAGLPANRRNVELLSRGLINHVRLTGEMGDHVPDDIVPYSTMEHLYKPREDAREVPPTAALNKYLEKPALHHTIGTKVRPSVMKDLKEFGVKKVTVHDEPPPFEPEMIRGMYNLAQDPDWMTKFYGSGLKGSLLKSVHRGSTSDEEGTSFVPSLARAVDFGRKGLVHTAEPGTKISSGLLDDEWGLWKESDAGKATMFTGNDVGGSKPPAVLKPPVTPAAKPVGATGEAGATGAAGPAPAPPAEPPAPAQPYQPHHGFGDYQQAHSIAGGNLLGGLAPTLNSMPSPLASLAVGANLDYSALGTLMEGITNRDRVGNTPESSPATPAPASSTTAAPTPASVATAPAPVAPAPVAPAPVAPAPATPVPSPTTSAAATPSDKPIYDLDPANANDRGAISAKTIAENDPTVTMLYNKAKALIGQPGAQAAEKQYIDAINGVYERTYASYKPSIVESPRAQTSTAFNVGDLYQSLVSPYETFKYTGGWHIPNYTLGLNKVPGMLNSTGDALKQIPRAVGQISDAVAEGGGWAQGLGRAAVRAYRAADNPWLWQQGIGRAGIEAENAIRAGAGGVARFIPKAVSYPAKVLGRSYSPLLSEGPARALGAAGLGFDALSTLGDLGQNGGPYQAERELSDFNRGGVGGLLNRIPTVGAPLALGWSFINSPAGQPIRLALAAGHKIQQNQWNAQNQARDETGYLPARQQEELNRLLVDNKPEEFNVRPPNLPVTDKNYLNAIAANVPSSITSRGSDGSPVKDPTVLTPPKMTPFGTLNQNQQLQDMGDQYGITTATGEKSPVYDYPALEQQITGMRNRDPDFAKTQDEARNYISQTDPDRVFRLEQTVKERNANDPDPANPNNQYKIDWMAKQPNGQFGKMIPRANASAPQEPVLTPNQQLQQRELDDNYFQQQDETLNKTPSWVQQTQGLDSLYHQMPQQRQHQLQQYYGFLLAARRYNQQEMNTLMADKAHQLLSPAGRGPRG